MDEEDWNLVPGHGLGPLELDLDRDTILQRLRKAKIALDVDEADPTSIEFVDDEIILTLDAESPHRLLQIEVTDERLRIDSQSVIDASPVRLIEAWNITERDTLWRHDPNDADLVTGAVEPSAADVSDRQLVINGTLWVVSYGIGLRLYRGTVEGILCRQPQHVPAHGSGPLTDRQRDLLSQADLDAALEPPPPPGANLMRTLQTLLTVAAVATIGVIFWRGVQFQQRWNHATKVEGTVVAVKPPPPQFWPDELTVEYADSTGKTHQVVWKPADVYVTNAVGQKVDVFFLPEAPDKPMGPARVRDAAFLVFVPYGIAVGVIYLVLVVGVGWLGKLLAAVAPPSDSAST